MNDYEQHDGLALAGLVRQGEVTPGELKEYVAFLTRILLRLSHVAPDAWPENPLTVEQVEAKLRSEIGLVQRTM